MAELRTEYNFRSFLVILAPLNTNFGGNHRNAMNRSLVKRRILLRHISKNRKVKFLKFYNLNSLMPLIMCTKCQINQVILRLFSGVRDKNHPPPPPS